MSIVYWLNKSLIWLTPPPHHHSVVIIMQLHVIISPTLHPQGSKRAPNLFRFHTFRMNIKYPSVAESRNISCIQSSADGTASWTSAEPRVCVQLCRAASVQVSMGDDLQCVSVAKGQAAHTHTQMDGPWAGRQVDQHRGQIQPSANASCSYHRGAVSTHTHTPSHSCKHADVLGK